MTAIKIILRSNDTSTCNRRENLVKSSCDAPSSAGGLPELITIVGSSPSLVELRGASQMQSTFDAAELTGGDLSATALMRCSIDPKSANTPEGRNGFRLMCGPTDIAGITNFSVLPGENKQANMSLDLTVIED
ncbi:MAG: hypothetical protein ABJ205_10600 [Erythrobacter sp.]|uniref:hypothetical protein n=1 Tax=Erythrobacter sp. TaxID=1042 RepID=UPI003265DC37